MKINDISALAKKFNKLNVLVFGDVGVDSYVIGEAKRISPEAPVPVVDVYDSYNRLGLSANVAGNIRALGAKCSIVGVVGDDDNATILRDELKEINVSSDGLVVDSDRYTTNKTRVLASRLHHVVRIDKEDRKELSPATQKQVLKRFASFLDGSDIVVVEDYGKGIFRGDLASEIIKLCRSKKKDIFVDPSRYTPSALYKGATLLKPNYDEAKILSGLDLEDEASLYECGNLLMDELALKYLVITRGKEGMTVFTRDNEPKTIPTFAIEVFDVSGAGDTVISALALSHAAGFNVYESALFANAAAAIVVAKVGTSVATLDEIAKFLKEHNAR